MEQGKVNKVKEWKPLHNIMEVWWFLGFTEYYWYFIQRYSQIAQPLLDLTKKAMLWHWMTDQQKAFKGLQDKMCVKLVLQQPNFKKTFYLQTNALAYGMGAILLQEGETTNSKPKCHPVAYYSATFTLTEQQYDIYKREFLAVIKALENWRAYLIWTKTPFVIKTDHKNLTFWKSPKKLNGRMACWHEHLQDYNFRIIHIAGKINTLADALSRPLGEDVVEDSQEIALLPPEVFLNVFGMDSDGSLKHHIVLAQQTMSKLMDDWSKHLPISRDNQVDGPVWWHKVLGRLLIPPNNKIWKEIMKVWHNHRGGGHPGQDETTQKVQWEYLWPKAWQWIDQYIKGCATCQQNKNLTHHPQVPLFKILVPDDTPPFMQIAMDLIMGLPKSWGHDAILTIIDHGCSEGTIFLPCLMTIMGPQIAQLYYCHMYPWFSLPRRLISD